MDFEPIDEGAAAWRRWLAQHASKPDTEAFVLSFYPPLTRLDAALHDLLTQRWLETAEGDALDGIGSIVGLTREIPDGVPLPFFGFDGQPLATGFGQARMRRPGEPYAVTYVMADVEYRRMIAVKIALNNGQGTAEEIISAVQGAFDVARVIIRDAGNANARIFIGRIIADTDPLRNHVRQMVQPRAAGVKFWIGMMDETDVFGFAGQGFGPKGFGAGVIARAV